MKVTFVLIIFLILEQVNGKKRVVIHVPNKINNIHHHHVKKVIVYKPVPVKCHQEENKHDWHEGWESGHKDEVADKRPMAPVKHPAWPGAEIIKGGYVSGERISDWDTAASVKHFKPLAELEVEEEEDVPPFHPYPKKRPSAVNNPWKAWTPIEVRATEPPVPVKQKAPQTPREQYVTYKVVKRKVVKSKVKKKPSTESSWGEGGHKSHVQTSWSDSAIKSKPRPKPAPHYTEGLKSTQYSPSFPDESPLYDQDVYVASSSSVKPQYYPKHPKTDSNVKDARYNTPYSNNVLNQNPYYGQSSTPLPYYEQDAYYASVRPYAQEAQASPHQPKYPDQDAYSSPVGRPIRTEQESYTFNSQNIKALLDQNVPTSLENTKRRPAYDLNIHNSNKVRPSSSSYQMRYLNLNNTTPVAFLINHRNMNLNNIE